MIAAGGQVGKGACRERELGGQVGDAVAFLVRCESGDEEYEFWQVASHGCREYRELYRQGLPCAAGVGAVRRRE